VQCQIAFPEGPALLIAKVHTGQMAKRVLAQRIDARPIEAPRPAWQECSQLRTLALACAALESRHFQKFPETAE
jgi:hypothetical protein